MNITPQTLKVLMTNYRQEFQGAVNAAESEWNKVAMLVPSSTAANTYGFLGQFPRFREWVGPRVVNDMKAHSYAIRNRTFEDTIGIGVDEMQDDNLGIYSPIVQEMGRAAATFPDEELIFPLFQRGFSEACYDGQNFFDAEHPVYANADGTGAAASYSNYFPGEKDADGNPVNPRWFLLDMTRALKPFIYQRRLAPQITQMTAMTDEAVFMENQFRMGIKARGEGGYGLWQLAAASDLPLTGENFRKVYDAMREIKGDGGRPLAIRPSLLVCPTSLEEQADKILKIATINGGDGNPNYNKADVLATPWLN